MNSFNKNLKHLENIMTFGWKSESLKNQKDSVIQLVKQVFSYPFQTMERKILEQDEFFQAYHDNNENATTAYATVDTQIKTFKVYLERLESELQEIIMEKDNRDNVVILVSEHLSIPFCELELQVVQIIPETSKTILSQNYSHKDIAMLSSMTTKQRVLYFLMNDINLEELTVNLDGGRCYSSDWISMLHLPYEKCGGNCLVSLCGKKPFHADSWENGTQTKMCLQASEHFDKLDDNGFDINSVIMLQSFWKKHIGTLPKKEVQELIHFIRMSNKFDPDTLWIFNMKGIFMKLTGEMFS